MVWGVAITKNSVPGYDDGGWTVTVVPKKLAEQRCFEAQSLDKEGQKVMFMAPVQASIDHANSRKHWYFMLSE